MDITFRLNGETVALKNVAPTMTLLDWLREDQGLTGTKEGCNEGDCGACTVMVSDCDGAKTLNACILFLPQINGKAVRTVEGVAAPDGTLHPVQGAMIQHHGSQCGFCTPGFVMSMVVSHMNGETDHDTQLAGNLCRCTGYAPIIRAAEAAAQSEVPAHLIETQMPDPTVPAAGNGTNWVQPETSDALAQWYLENPDATLIGGATDVGLWVTKNMQQLEALAFLNRCTDIRGVFVTDKQIDIGAATTLNELQHAIAPFHPSFAEMISRYGSVQVRNAATIGGNIANGSPIGDGPPALIALGARLHLRRGNKRRSMPLEDFFLDYGKQDRQPGEFVERISVPRQKDRLKCYKLSKRFDQDISAVCGCFSINVAGTTVLSARIVYGGMAGTPKRAATAEAALLGAEWSEETVQRAMTALRDDFSPMTDMRASAAYRMRSAQNMIHRYWLEDQGARVSVLGQLS